MLSRLFENDETDLRGAFAAIISISSIGIALGLAFPLLSIILDNRGYSGAVIGANAAMAGLASVAAVWLVTPCVNRFGVTGSLVLAALVASASLMGFYLFDSLWVWFALRASFHGALTLSFALSEFWINSATSEKRRGLMLGIYATVLSAGFGIGPAILAATGASGIAPFVIGSLVLAFAALPILAVSARQPALDDHMGSSSAFLRFVWVVPLATAAVFVFGAVEQSVLPLLPIYGQRIGFSEADVPYLLMAVAAGNVSLQIPLGIFSDRLPDRRYALYLCGVIGALGTALIPFVANHVVLLFLTLFIWGGMISGLYTVGLAHLGSRLKGSELALANSAFVFCYCLGMMVGPQASGIAMDWANPHGFVWALFTFFIAYLALYVWRAKARR